MKTFWIALLLFGSVSASLAATPQQLNIQGFAGCLREKQDSVDLDFTRKTYSPGDFDFMLPYLAFYPAHWPFPLKLGRDDALKRWSGKFAEQEETVALRLVDLSAFAEAQAVFPAELFGLALDACKREPADVFCASLVAHNVLRTLGRNTEAAGDDGDFNPDWFKSEHADWGARIPVIQSRLIPLRRDGGGDRWGEWYHFFGVLTYAIHEETVHGDLSSADFAARMNDLLNPLLTGSPEDPAKAQVDKDAVQVADLYLKYSARVERSGCESSAAYVESGTRVTSAP